MIHSHNLAVTTPTAQCLEAEDCQTLEEAAVLHQLPSMFRWKDKYQQEEKIKDPIQNYLGIQEGLVHLLHLDCLEIQANQDFQLHLYCLDYLGIQANQDHPRKH